MLFVGGSGLSHSQKFWQPHGHRSAVQWRSWDAQDLTCWNGRDTKVTARSPLPGNASGHEQNLEGVSSRMLLAVVGSHARHEEVPADASQNCGFPLRGGLAARLQGPGLVTGSADGACGGLKLPGRFQWRGFKVAGPCCSGATCYSVQPLIDWRPSFRWTRRKVHGCRETLAIQLGRNAGIRDLEGQPRKIPSCPQTCARTTCRNRCAVEISTHFLCCHPHRLDISPSSNSPINRLYTHLGHSRDHWLFSLTVD